MGTKATRRSITYSFARPDDRNQIRRLLSTRELPTVYVHRDLKSFMVVRADKKIIGVVGGEVCGRTGLFRSLCVDESYGGRGIAKMLKSQTVWPKLVELKNKKRKHHFRYMVFSSDKNKNDAATLVSKHRFPKFLLNWVKPWEQLQLKLSFQSLGMNIEEPLTLPFIVIRDSKGNVVKQWNGIRDLFEVEDVLNSLDEREWR